MITAGNKGATSPLGALQPLDNNIIKGRIAKSEKVHGLIDYFLEISEKVNI